MFDDPQLQFIGFESMDEDALASIQRELATLYGTPEGTCPGDRSFGIDWSFLDYPLDVAQNMYALEVIDKTEMYVQGIEVLEVIFDQGMDGNLKAVITIGPEDETDGDPDGIDDGEDT